jgi:hypothetical protein
MVGKAWAAYSARWLDSSSGHDHRSVPEWRIRFLAARNADAQAFSNAHTATIEAVVNEIERREIKWQQ